MRDRPNLAVNPFVDRRPVLVTGALLAAVAVALSAISIGEFVTAQGAERALAVRLKELGDRRAELVRAVESTNSGLQTVKWKDLEQETGSLAKIVAGRNLAWSRMLADLETVLPWDVRLVNVVPQVRDDGTCEVVLSGYASGRGAWLTLLGRLFTHERFADPVPVAEEAPGPSNALGHRFQIRVSYWMEGRP